MKVRGALYVLTYEYNYKIITGCGTILQEYYITDRRKYENIKRYTIMNSIKCAHELQKDNPEMSRGPERIGTRTDLPLIHVLPLCNSDQQEVHKGSSSKI